jgi:hypothetical protein
VLGNWTVIDRIYYTWKELPKPARRADAQTEDKPLHGRMPLRAGRR